MHRYLAVLMVGIAALLSACTAVPQQQAAPAAAPTLPAAPGGAAASQVLSDGDPNPAVDNWQVVDAPDPFVLRVDPSYCAPDGGAPTACYYAYSTMVYYNPVPVWRSSDLTHWHPAGRDGSDADAFADGTAVESNTFASWAQYFEKWAPSVVQINGTYVMWYAARSKTSGHHCLGVARAASPDGPFVDVRTPYCRDAQGGVIDPSPFVDSNGQRYLTYKTEDSGGRIYAANLSSDGTQLLREGFLLGNNGGWEQPRIEGPNLVRSSSGLFLFYSAGSWDSANYRVGVAKCDGPLGPCNRVYSTAVLSSRGSTVGPGGQTPFVDAGNALRLAFHAWTSPGVGYSAGGARSLRVLTISWPNGTPKIG
jgi:beta-xylosidase